MAAFALYEERIKMVGRGMGHDVYLEETNKAISMLSKDKIRVLKADVFNEITLRHPIPGGILLNLERDKLTMELHAIDCDQWKLDQAQYMQLYEFVKYVKGDIRKMPYEDKYFDIALDFSTLDHIELEGMSSAFAEYGRVLIEGGLFVCFVWCADKYKYGGKPDHSGWENQHFFLLEDVRSRFQQTFNIVEEEKGYAYPFEDTLIFMYRFLGRKI